MTTPSIPKGDKAKIVKLAITAQALRDGQETYASITRLTSLKSLCKEPATAQQFVFYLAQRTQTRMEATLCPGYKSEADWALYRTLITEAVAVMSHYLVDPTTTNQTSVRQVGWNNVRIIHSNEVLLVEYALECILSPQAAPEYAYLVGRQYTERYDSRYGTGLIPASASMLEDIVQFWRQYYDL